MTKRVSIKISNRRAIREFGRPPNLGCVACPEFEVDLDSLSPVAKDMVSRIVTTWNGDTFSHVHIQSVESVIEINRRLEPRLWTAEYEANMRKVFRAARWDGPQHALWQWGCMRDGESPEQYFNRQAEELLAAGFVLSDSKKPMG